MGWGEDREGRGRVGLKSLNSFSPCGIELKSCPIPTPLPLQSEKNLWRTKRIKAN